MVGTNVMIAGLAWQVFTILIFMILCAEYAYRVSRSTREQDNTYADLRQSKMFKYYLYSLTFAILCILTRSVYRLIELSQGWEGELISRSFHPVVSNTPH